MSCMARIIAKLKKNVHTQEIKEPNLLKNEMYRLNFEKEKVQQAEVNINKVLEDIARCNADKDHALGELQRFKDGEAKRRAQLEAKIVTQQEVVKKKIEANETKKEDLKGQTLELDKEHKVIADKNKGRRSFMKSCLIEKPNWRETTRQFVTNTSPCAQLTLKNLRL